MTSMTARREEARPSFRPGARRAITGGFSLTPTAKDCIFAVLMLFMCLGVVWGISAMYQAGYVDGYESAKAVYSG